VLDAGAKVPALALFKETAMTSGPKSPDVQQLLFLWGPRPPAEGIVWLTARAKNAPRAERGQWLDLMTDSGAADASVRLARDFYAAGDRSVAAAYADALVTLKRDSELHALLQREIAAPSPGTATTIALARSADARSFGGDASALYERANMIAPAARSAWYAGERARALTLFQRALTGKAGTALDHFLYGEALRNAKDSGATDHYETALTLTQGKPAREDRRIRALALARLGRFDEAEQAIAGDASMRADYASVLLDDGRSARTGQILSDASTR
jgi:cellulose synthase operon protein C